MKIIKRRSQLPCVSYNFTIGMLYRSRPILVVSWLRVVKLCKLFNHNYSSLELKNLSLELVQLLELKNSRI